MTSPSFRTDPAVLNDLRRGDEGALERLFRGTYSGLIDNAKAELGDAAGSANRVVEKVFVRVWSERGSFSTPEALDKFVHGAVHEAAVRERSRLGALHRLDTGERASAQKKADASVDDVWSRISSSLHAGTGSQVARDQARISRSHEAATHVAALGKKNTWVVPAIVLVATAVAATAGISFLARGGEEVVLSNSLNSADVKTISTGMGQSANMMLNDSSMLKLAPNTRVRIPSKFAISLRGIRIDGSAQVTAKSGLKDPLEVRIGKAAIVSSGGVFDVSTDSVSGMVVARLRDGAATLKIGKQETPMTANTAVALDSATKVSAPAEAAVAEALGWIDGKVTISQRPLRDVIKLMKQWWGLEIYLKDQKLGDRVVTMTADLDSPKSAIDAAAKGGQLTFGYEGKNMIFTEGKKK